ncbi:Pentatricopeptide repeat-containing protein At1g74850 [Durusdinium trenchii]|uniref:Chloroplastic (Protein PLASTID TRANSCRIPTIONALLY ACTIVE 2) n=1 Tax=Durusdinium trenchii TaxID=1381693 RepID=A0ABP0N251_9DINO
MAAITAVTHQGRRCQEAELPHRSLEPDLVSFNTALEAVEAVDFETLWERLAQSGLQPDEITYRSAAFVLSKAAQWKQVLELMSQDTCAIDASYYTALSTLAQSNKGFEAMGLLEQMRRKRLTPSQEMYSLGLSAHMASG